LYHDDAKAQLWLRQHCQKLSEVNSRAQLDHQ